MFKLIIGLTLLLTVGITDQVQEQPPVGGKGWVAGMPLPAKENFNYKVDIHFVMIADEVNRYPDIYNSFLHATSIWGQYLPVNFVFRFDTEFPKSAKIPSDLVQVKIYSISEELGFPGGIIGLWNGSLHLDSTLNDDKLRALTVAMHELGHMFGIPHIVGFKDTDIPTRTGYIRVPGSARQAIMFPYEMLDNKYRWTPTPVEVEIAKNFVKNRLGATYFAVHNH